MSAPAHTPLFLWLGRHWVCAFGLMSLSFVLFGAASLNLAQVFMANFEFLAKYGWDAVADGGLRQLAELVATAGVAIAFYLLFKTCEQALVQRLVSRDPRKDP